MKRLNQRGDTIVEVLICLLIISVVLVGAYVSSNRSLSYTRQAQERSEGLKYAEQQVEKFKTLTSIPGYNNFCLKDDNTSVLITNPPSPEPDLDTFSSTNYPPECKTTTGVPYYQWIAKDPATNSITIRIRWSKLVGVGNNEVKLTVGQGIAVAAPTDTSPIVTLSPSSTTVNQGQTAVLTATASDDQGVSKVEFYDNSSIISACTDTTAPYVCNWDTTGVAGGTHSVIARAYDTITQTTDSSSVTVTVNATDPSPTVSLSPPSPSTVNQGQTVTLTATASDNNGINRVEFYDNSSIISACTDTTSPYVCNWNTTGVATGSHSNVTARAYSNAGGQTANSSAVTVTINTLALPDIPLAYTTCGNFYSYTVPSGYTSAAVDVRGGSGGGGKRGNSNLTNGGYGGRTQATVNVTPGSTLYVYIGCRGNDGTSSGAAGGYNGGGRGGSSSTYYLSYGGSGGGASDIRIDGTSLSNRIVIAGGGGGGGGGYNCGGSGGSGANSSSGYGGNGSNPSCGIGGTFGYGGSSISGGGAGSPGAGNGSSGSGGSGGGGSTYIAGGGGGGGGYYGGGGGGRSGGTGSGNYNAAGGGAGSSYCDNSYCSGTSYSRLTTRTNGAIYITLSP
jgi:hypothetical protein